uniref:Uncharacterized protein n=1 Tax=Parascaris equorum TaxID=6256 RepID=A0A914R7L8_PAREQ
MVNELNSKKGEKSAKKENRFLNGTKAVKKSGGSHNRKVISSEEEEEEEEEDTDVEFEEYKGEDSVSDESERNTTKRSPISHRQGASFQPSVSNEMTFEERDSEDHVITSMEKGFILTFSGTSLPLMIRSLLEEGCIRFQTARLRTISESDSEEKHVISQPKWLCKPRLRDKKSVDRRCAVYRKRAFISSSMYVENW